MHAGVREWVSEWVSEWQQFSNCSAISWREQVHFQWDGDDFRFVLDQYAELDFYSDNSLKQHFADSEPTSLYSFSLMLCA